jgi:hypothetical protein
MLRQSQLGVSAWQQKPTPSGATVTPGGKLEGVEGVHPDATPQATRVRDNQEKRGPVVIGGRG